MIASTRRRYLLQQIVGQGVFWWNQTGPEMCGYLKWHWIIDYHELGLGSGAATFDYVNSAGSALDGRYFCSLFRRE